MRLHLLGCYEVPRLTLASLIQHGRKRTTAFRRACSGDVRADLDDGIIANGAGSCRCDVGCAN